MSNVSEYSPLWEQLKNSEPKVQGVTHIRSIRITAPRSLHKRIVKAVIKRKWLDLGHKIMLDSRKDILYHTREASMITFFLVQTISQEDL